MVDVGAAGETATQLRTTLHYKGRSLAMDFLLPSGSLSDLEASLAELP